MNGTDGASTDMTSCGAPADCPQRKLFGSLEDETDELSGLLPVR